MNRVYLLRGHQPPDPPGSHAHQQNLLQAELIGLLNGILCDGQITGSELRFLKNWLVERGKDSALPSIESLTTLLQSVDLEGDLSSGKAHEIAETLTALAAYEPDAKRKPIRFLFDECPHPSRFQGKRVCLTGTFTSNTRKKIKESLSEFGAQIIDRIDGTAHFLLVGSAVTPSWSYGNYGAKIECALRLKQAGHPIAIIAEESWVKIAANDTV